MRITKPHKRAAVAKLKPVHQQRNNKKHQPVPNYRQGIGMLKERMETWHVPGFQRVDPFKKGRWMLSLEQKKQRMNPKVGPSNEMNNLNVRITKRLTSIKTAAIKKRIKKRPTPLIKK